MQQTIESVSQPTVNRQTMSIVDEVWKDIPEYEGYYQVSSIGRVRSCDRVVSGRWGLYSRVGALRSPSIDRYGYLQLVLHKLSRAKHFPVHTLVASAFLGARPEGFHVNHVDGNKLNNFFGNLEYCTTQENTAHAIALGLQDNKGELNFSSVLTESDVISIRLRLAAGELQVEIAKSFGVCRSTISAIKCGKTWAHI